MFDLELFKGCKRSLETRDRRLALVIVDEILRSPINNGVRFLDVGTGTGSFLRGVLDGILSRAHGSRIEALCVEPTSEAWAELGQLARDYNELDVGVSVYKGSIEAYVAEDRMESFSAAVLCHVLYHIPQSKWVQLLLHLQNMLQPSGRVLIDLVSRNSGIYRLWEKVEPVVEEADVLRRFDECGALVFAEDLAETLDGAGISYRREVVRARYDAARLGAGAWTNALAFFFRLHPDDLTRALLEVSSGGVEDPRDLLGEDHLFVIEAAG